MGGFPRMAGVARHIMGGVPCTGASCNCTAVDMFNRSKAVKMMVLNGGSVPVALSNLNRRWGVFTILNKVNRSSQRLCRANLTRTRRRSRGVPGTS
eukprot:SAG22_NODE_112_length_19423_cov_11.462223_6_plen_96_part_00